jgi:hypothetical protein
MIEYWSSPLEQNDTPAAHSCQLRVVGRIRRSTLHCFRVGGIGQEPAKGNVKLPNENGTRTRQNLMSDS